VGRPDILLVSVDSTTGWRSSVRELAGSFSRAGAIVESVGTGPVPQVRTFALTDLVQARAARRACMRAVAERDPAAIVYCSVTAALMWPRPGAIWLDSIAAENRPGRHGIWQRAVERRRLRRAPLVLAMSEHSLAPLNGPHADVVVVPTPVECSDPAAARSAARDVAALTYAGNPEKKRLEFILAAWSRARRADETLVVAGIDRLDPVDGVELAGRLPAPEYRALLRRARVFVAAPRREDYGIAPLEALADGCLLVTAPAPGPYPALEIAHRLDPRLVDDDLAKALRFALDDPVPGYAERARELLAPFSRAAVDRTIAERVLPRLLPGWAPHEA
jgi:glycosyltransferase involved in cell wall biosynthesis